MTRLEFPKNFWWGAATSGPQTEGRFHKSHANIFDYDFDKFPEHFGTVLVQIQHQTSIMILNKILL